MKKFVAILTLAQIMASHPALAKIKAESCSINVLQFFDRTYEGFAYVDEGMLALFSDPKLGNFSEVELIDSILVENDGTTNGQKSYLKLYNKSPEKAYLEAIRQNVDPGEYYATFKTSCSKDKLDSKDDHYKWKYKCKLKMSIGQFAENEHSGDTYTHEIVESSKRTVKLKVKDQLSLEAQDTVNELRAEHASHQEFREEFFIPLRRDNLPEMQNEYRQMVEKLLSRNKFSCKEVE